MRKLLTLLALCTAAHLAVAQTTMNIYQSNGSVLQIPVSTIDSITYSISGGGGTLNPNLTYGSMTDQEGNTYATIQIGGQEWMAQNLATSIYRNGDVIPTNLSNSQWQNTTSGAYSVYNDDPAYGLLYGKLYNWYAVEDSREICPTGWHVPTDQDWTTLFVSLDPNTNSNAVANWTGASFIPWDNPSSTLVGGLMKSTVTYNPSNGNGAGYWYPPNGSATNQSGFSALPGGYKRTNGTHDDSYLAQAYWWSSTAVDITTAYNRMMFYYQGDAYRVNLNKKYGCSVRCVRD